ncbi:hypothetical protein [Riemerella columbipharyngis]|nr:hypothetical protein [Riemerella columbipharyngis]
MKYFYCRVGNTRNLTYFLGFNINQNRAKFSLDFTSEILEQAI